MNKPKKVRCYHGRNSWIICGGHAEWCFACGAWRQLQRLDAVSSVPYSEWHLPSGDPKVDPALEEKI